MCVCVCKINICTLNHCARAINLVNCINETCTSRSKNKTNITEAIINKHKDNSFCAQNNHILRTELGFIYAKLLPEMNKTSSILTRG